MKYLYIQSFSKGQITVPKALRSQLGLGDVFTLRLSIDKGRIIAEPVDVPTPADSYKQLVASMDTQWFTHEDQQNMADARTSANTRFKNHQNKSGV